MPPLRAARMPRSGGGFAAKEEAARGPPAPFLLTFACLILLRKVLYVWFDAPIGYISSTKEWAARVGKDWEPY